MNANGEMEDEVTNNKIEDLFAEPEFDEDDAGQGQFEKKRKIYSVSNIPKMHFAFVHLK